MLLNSKYRFAKNVGALAIGGFLSLNAVADWPQFRGPNAASGIATANIPTEFSVEDKKNISWSASLPGRGVSGPIVVANQVITTSSSGIDQRRIYVTSNSTKDGKLLWEQQFVARGRPFCHPTSANAAPTPTSDGKNVFAFFSSNDLICLDLQGNLLWYRSLAVDYPKAGNDVGMSSSPVVAEGVVTVQIESQGDAFVVGLDSETGETLWRVDRAKEANWSSPTVAKTADGKEIFIFQSSKTLVGIVPRTGKELWNLPAPCSSIPSAAVQGNIVYVPSKGITAYELGSSDQPPSKAWNNSKLSPNSASPVVVKNQIFTVKGGVMFCADTQTGDMKWQLRMGEVGSVWSSTVMAGNHLYLFSQSGECFVVEAQESEGVVAGTYKLGDDVLGSPAIDGDAMYVRSVGKLWKIAKE